METALYKNKFIIIIIIIIIICEAFTANTGCLSTYNSIFGCLNGVRRHCTGDRFSIEQGAPSPGPR